MRSELNTMLLRWGDWKRYKIIHENTEGYAESGIEYQLIKGEIFGSGNYGEKNKPSGLENKLYRSSPAIERYYRQLKRAHPIEMDIIFYVYVMKWSIRKISSTTKETRYAIRQKLERAKTLLEGWVFQ